jgi:hypothetical protein
MPKLEIYRDFATIFMPAEAKQPPLALRDALNLLPVRSSANLTSVKRSLARPRVKSPTATVIQWGMLAQEPGVKTHELEAHLTNYASSVTPSN